MNDPVTATPVADAAAPANSPPAVRMLGLLGAVVGYGGLVAFLCLIAVQSYRWFRDGEWTHVGIADGLRVALDHCCVSDASTGRLAALVHWLDTPVDWLGLHRVLEVIPASLALFAISIVGNSLYIYCSDRSDERKGG